MNSEYISQLPDTRIQVTEKVYFIPESMAFYKEYRIGTKGNVFKLNPNTIYYKQIKPSKAILSTLKRILKERE